MSHDKKHHSKYRLYYLSPSVQNSGSHLARSGLHYSLPSLPFLFFPLPFSLPFPSLLFNFLSLSQSLFIYFPLSCSLLPSLLVFFSSLLSPSFLLLLPSLLFLFPPFLFPTPPFLLLPLSSVSYPSLSSFNSPFSLFPNAPH